MPMGVFFLLIMLAVEIVSEAVATYHLGVVLLRSTCPSSSREWYLRVAQQCRQIHNLDAVSTNTRLKLRRITYAKAYDSCFPRVDRTK